jgi:N-acyl amino acid synthase FeeM
MGKPCLPEVTVATTEEERIRVYQFRYSIYVEEMGKNLSYANHAEKILRDELDGGATLLYVTHDTSIIASLRIVWGEGGPAPDRTIEDYGLVRFSTFSSGAFSYTSRMMIAPAWRRSRALVALVEKAYQLMRARVIRFDFINCAPHLVPFFERMGHRRYKPAFIDPDVGYRVPMVLLLEDLEHLLLVRSPLVREARRWKNDPDIACWFKAILVSPGEFPVLCPEEEDVL